MAGTQGTYGVGYDFWFPDGSVTRDVTISATKRIDVDDVLDGAVVRKPGPWRVVDKWQFPTHVVVRLESAD
jgi:hypothetical protein